MWKDWYAVYNEKGTEHFQDSEHEAFQTFLANKRYDWNAGKIYWVLKLNSGFIAAGAYVLKVRIRTSLFGRWLRPISKGDVLEDSTHFSHINHPQLLPEDEPTHSYSRKNTVSHKVNVKGNMKWV